jgi:hypothetical protein
MCVYELEENGDDFVMVNIFHFTNKNVTSPFLVFINRFSQNNT